MSVFQRLNDPAGFTGVYYERFRVGPGINADSESRAGALGSPATRLRLASRGVADADPPHPPPPAHNLHQRRDASPRQPPADEEEKAISVSTHLRLLFEYYARFGYGGAAAAAAVADAGSGSGGGACCMDGRGWAKLVRECPDLLDAPGRAGRGVLTPADADIVFARARAAAGAAAAAALPACSCTASSSLRSLSAHAGEAFRACWAALRAARSVCASAAAAFSCSTCCTSIVLLLRCMD